MQGMQGGVWEKTVTKENVVGPSRGGNVSDTRAAKHAEQLSSRADLNKHVQYDLAANPDLSTIGKTFAAPKSNATVIPGTQRADGTNSKNLNTSWADKVRVTSAKSRFCLEGDSDLVRGQAAYEVPDDFIEEEFGDWSRCLVGFIPGVAFPFHAARSIALKVWRSYGIESVSSFENFFIFRFKNEENLHEVLADGPWLFGGKYMMLQQWHPCFVFDKSKLSKVPVWVRLRGLPFTLWNSKALGYVASIVGKPLSCDRATHERTRLSYARVCVEVDANYPYVHKFDLNCKLSSTPIHIDVDYDWKPQRCSKCCVYGHNCEANKPIEKTQEEVQVKPVDNMVVMEQKLLSGNNRENLEFNNRSTANKEVHLNINDECAKTQSTSEKGESSSSSRKKVIIALPPEPMAKLELDNFPRVDWEQKQFASVALTSAEMDSPISSSDDDNLAQMDDDGALMVDPLLSFGALEGPCRLNTSASINSQGFSTPGSRKNSIEKGKASLSIDEPSKTSSYSFRPQRAKKKGRGRRGGRGP